MDLVHHGQMASARATRLDRSPAPVRWSAVPAPQVVASSAPWSVLGSDGAEGGKGFYRFCWWMLHGGSEVAAGRAAKGAVRAWVKVSAFQSAIGEGNMSKTGGALGCTS